MFLVKGFWCARPGGSSCPSQLSNQVSFWPDPAAIPRQGVLNFEDNRFAQIRRICIKYIRNLLPQVGKGEGEPKSHFQQSDVCPPTSHISAKHQTTPGVGQNTANSENPLQEQLWSFVREQKLCMGQLLSAQTSSLRKPPGCSLLPPFPRLCSGWPGASAGPRCGGHTSSCPSWSSLWSSAGVSPPRSEALKENKGRNGSNEEPGRDSWLFTEPQNRWEKTSKISRSHHYPRAVRSTTKSPLKFHIHMFFAHKQWEGFRGCYRSFCAEFKEK